MIQQPFAIEVDSDLCDLLRTMKLESSNRQEELGGNANVAPPSVEDTLMDDQPTYYHDEASQDTHSSLSSSKGEESYGCAYLQALRSQLDNYQTTGGEYLEAIFTHREILSAFPGGHQQCARGFSDLAYTMEQRAWRADRDSDAEAVVAFRHEAWMIAASL